MGKQTQAYTKEHVYPTTLTHLFTSSANIAVNAGAFPATGDKVALSAAQSVKVLEPGGLGLTAGQIQLDDTNDRILLDPGIYEVSYHLMLRDNGTDSDVSFALTTAAQAANDLSLANVNGGVLTGGQALTISGRITLTVTAARALELHLAATTASGAVSLRAGSVISVRRLGNIDV